MNSDSQSAQQEQWQPVRLPNGQQFYAQTRDSAARFYAAVADQYLVFRRDYFHDTQPSLATDPPRTDAVQQSETGKIADRALRVVPHAVRDLPLIRELMDHLQWEVDIHTLTSRERIDLHNITMVFLYGTDGGIQPWYVEWLVEQMHRIQGVTHPKYYLAFPWHGLLYRSNAELQAIDTSVQKGDVFEIERWLEHYAAQLVDVLKDPLRSQPKLAFSGPHAEERKMLFNLKTSAAIALGAYLAVEAARDLLGARHTTTPPESMLGPLPQQLMTRMIPDQTQAR